MGYKTYHYEIVNAKIHFRLDYTHSSYIYIVFKQLLMQCMAIWMYLSPSKPWRWVNLLNLGIKMGYKPYHYDMVESESHFRLDFTSIS